MKTLKEIKDVVESKGFKFEPVDGFDFHVSFTATNGYASISVVVNLKKDVVVMFKGISQNEDYLDDVFCSTRVAERIIEKNSKRVSSIGVALDVFKNCYSLLNQ